jgi:hypothetical protein
MPARPVRYGSRKSVVAEEPRPLEAIRCVIMDNLCRIFSISQKCSCNTSDEGTSNEKWGGRLRERQRSVQTSFGMFSPNHRLPEDSCEVSDATH